MKTVYKSFFSVAILSLAFAGCTKQEVNSIDDSQISAKQITFHAITPETRTTFGTLANGKYPTIWSANDTEVKIAQNYTNAVAAAVTKISDTEASFDATFTDDESGSYTFYAVSPASQVISGVNDRYFSWNLEIPTEQTPTTTGPDEKAMLMVATSTTSTSFPTSVDFSFTHLTAYAKMTITNLSLDEGDKISSVLVTASNNIAYRYFYYVGGENAGTMVESSAQKAITIHTESASDIWFGCAPLASGTILSIAVTTANSKVYTKENIAIPAALNAGHVAVFNVNFSGISSGDDKVYNLVTSYDDLTAGSKVILAAIGAFEYAAGIGSTSSNYLSEVSTPKSDDFSKITNPASTVDVFTIEAGTNNNTIALKGTNGYVYASSSSSNYMSIQSTNDANGSWLPTIKNATTGEMLLVAQGANRPYMRYNGGASRFSCYASEGDNVALYKLAGSGSGGSLITTVTVTYNGNGNTAGEVPSAFVTTGAFTVADAGTLVKTGYVFNGWNTSANGSGTSYEVGDVVTVTANTTLYAQWKESTGETLVTFVAGTDVSSTTTLTKDDVTITTTSGTFSRTDNYRIYANNSMTVSVPEGCEITSIVFTISQNTFTTETGEYDTASQSWTGSEQSVTLSASGGQVRITKIVVTYK